MDKWVKAPGKKFWGYRVGTVSAFVWQVRDSPGDYRAQVVGLCSGEDTDIAALKRWAAKEVDTSQDPVGAADVDLRITRKQFNACVAEGRPPFGTYTVADDDAP